MTDEGTLTIENTHLMGVDGRGILVVADEAVVHLVDTWVSDGVADYGGGIAIDACASVTVDDGSRIVGNTALIDGGGIWDGPASCAFETIEIRGRIDDNEAAVNGGGLYVDGSRAVLVGEAAIEKNRAVAGSGGGVYATLGATLELEGTMWTPVPELGIPTGGLRPTGSGSIISSPGASIPRAWRVAAGDPRFQRPPCG